MVKVAKENPYPKTIQLIYSQASERIVEKYNAWTERQPKRPAKVDVYSDTKLLTNVLEYHITKKINDGNYSKLVSLNLAKALVTNLGFKDLNEVYWGDPQIYFKDYIVTLLLEMQESEDYSGYFWDIPLSTKEDIEKFYRNYTNEILTDGERGQSLLSRFIDFTYNVHESLEPVGDVFEIQDVKVDNSGLKNISSETLTFENLPHSLNVFIKEILLPFIWCIGFDDFNQRFEQESQRKYDISRIKIKKINKK
ncbi:hypothetical protein [Listeria monocytogenes]|uniref:hypothetical protein n=1 Tax=Listeria monocytogenes TaxID=1639 RepID=UPI00083DEAB7|nr:hypothetical protein [Listeria monocytogenes]MDA5983909.1 hypothetical protein [Listeria monocytogenes]ODC27210.1 hypothetical protein BB572_10705 [Listeria monocytogenes]HAA9305389.1 hypothetical protein [Listeria monocytogenes]HAB7537449.1 hypothetical protein [Listeria monocytogenes]